MRKRNLLLLIILLQLIFSQVVLAEVDFSRELFRELAQNKNQIPEIEVPDYKRLELANGMVVYLIEDKQLPAIQLQGYINGGQRGETREVAGISELMLEMMETGTGNLTEKEMIKYKELNGIDFNLSAVKDTFNLSANALNTEAEELISLTADVLQTPDFEAEYLERIKGEFYQLLAYGKFRDDLLLEMYFNKNLYGDHPYAYGSNLDLKMKALHNIGAKELEQFHQESVGPENTILAIIGDLETDKMEELLKSYFAEWERKGIEIKQPPVKEREKNYNRIIVVNKEDATQAKMKLGYNFFDEYFAERTSFMMANRIYGGGNFSSRLMNNLRSEKGYVYGIHSTASYNQLGGDFYISTDVEPTKSYEARELIIEEMLAIKEGTKKITEDELFENVNLYNAFLPKSYQSKLDIFRDFVYQVELLDKDETYITEMIKEYNELDATEAQRVFAEYSYPDRFFTVIVGKSEEIVPAFQERGIEVEVVEINR